MDASILPARSGRGSSFAWSGAEYDVQIGRRTAIGGCFHTRRIFQVCSAKGCELLAATEAQIHQCRRHCFGWRLCPECRYKSSDSWDTYILYISNGWGQPTSWRVCTSCSQWFGFGSWSHLVPLSTHCPSATAVPGISFVWWRDSPGGSPEAWSPTTFRSGRCGIFGRAVCRWPSLAKASGSQNTQTHHCGGAGTARVWAKSLGTSISLGISRFWRHARQDESHQVSTVVATGCTNDCRWSFGICLWSQVWFYLHGICTSGQGWSTSAVSGLEPLRWYSTTSISG